MICLCEDCAGLDRPIWLTERGESDDKSLTYLEDLCLNCLNRLYDLVVAERQRRSVDEW